MLYNYLIYMAKVISLYTMSLKYLFAVMFQTADLTHQPGGMLQFLLC